MVGGDRRVTRPDRGSSTVMVIDEFSGRGSIIVIVIDTITMSYRTIRRVTWPVKNAPLLLPTALNKTFCISTGGY